LALKNGGVSGGFGGCCQFNVFQNIWWLDFSGCKLDGLSVGFDFEANLYLGCRKNLADTN